MSKLRCLIWLVLSWALFLLAGCGWWQPATPARFLPAMTPKAGGMVLPTAQPPIAADGTSATLTQARFSEDVDNFISECAAA
jgi:multidrug efflux pump subunit AcrA (membrane-fusion protein)